MDLTVFNPSLLPRFKHSEFHQTHTTNFRITLKIKKREKHEVTYQKNTWLNAPLGNHSYGHCNCFIVIMIK